MNPFGGLDYFLILLIVLLPVVVCGLKGVRLRVCGMLVCAVMLLAIFRTPHALLLLAAFWAWQTALTFGYLLCRYLMRSRLGKVTIAIRDAESRTRFMGYRVEYFKLAIFTVAAMLAGIAGALYVPQVGIINPGEFNPINSIEIVIWVAVGGRASLYGAIVGAILVNYAKTVFTGIFPDGWLYALGLIFVLVTLFLPKGIVGIIGMIRAKRAERKALAEADAGHQAAAEAEPAAAAEASPKEA